MQNLTLSREEENLKLGHFNENIFRYHRKYIGCDNLGKHWSAYRLVLLKELRYNNGMNDELKEQIRELIIEVLEEREKDAKEVRTSSACVCLVMTIRLAVFVATNPPLSGRF